MADAGRTRKPSMLRCPDQSFHLWYSKVAHHLKPQFDHCVKCGYIRKLRTYARRSNIDRFMALTKRDESGCLLWTGGTNDKGYGLFNARNGDKVRSTLAHRWIFREKFGYLPEVVMHDCDVKRCVNWESCLMPGTYADNMQDMIRKGRDDHRGAGSKRLTPEQVKEIRTRRADGETCRSLAAEFGFSINAISQCVNGHTYKDTV